MLGKMFGKKNDKVNEKDERLTRNQKLVASMKLQQSQMFEPDQIELGALIGQGGFARVYHCKLDGQAAVCKAINAEKLDDEATYLLMNECTIWSKIKHRNIVSFYGMATTSSAMWLLCELLREGSLLDMHERQRKAGAPPPSEASLVDGMGQVASGMAYLHGLEPPVLHRDLKSANILMAESGARLAIADFGLARYQESGREKMTAETGSYRWMAPEVIRHEKYDERCDVYSWAVLGWEMVTYRVPFDKLMPVQAAFAVAKEGRRPELPDSCPASIRELIEAAWRQEARQRPPFSELCERLAQIGASCQ